MSSVSSFIDWGAIAKTPGIGLISVILVSIVLDPSNVFNVNGAVPL